MKLVCASCSQRWTPEKGQKRTESCPRCRRFHLSSAQIMGWQRRRFKACPEAVPDAGPDLPDTLESLMRAADAASAKALNAALSVAQRTLKGNRN
jgi:hypothetical protein